MNHSRVYHMTQSLPSILPGAEPFFHRGNTIGCLCIHGFMASPSEVYWQSLHLAEQGYTLYAPRLPGHGGDYRAMAHMRWQDWYDGVLNSWHVLRAQCDQVFVVGHSMGGMLGILLAASVSVDGLIVLAAPVIFRHRLVALANWLKYARPFTDQSDKTNLAQMVREEQMRRSEAVNGRVRYETWSTSAVYELYTLAGVVREHLPEVKAPLLAVYSEGDQTVSLENRDYIISHVGSKQVEQQTLQQSDHILTMDSERDTVFQWVAAFIARNSNSTG
jgi:carboxylesterase